MDYQNYAPNYTPIDKRSHSMETAALILSIISIATCTCIYFSIPLGALAVIFASLSRGGETNYNSKSRLAFCLGLAGIIITTILYAVSLITLLYQYGSIEGIVNAYSQMTGIDYNELIQEMNSAY